MFGCVYVHENERPRHYGGAMSERVCRNSKVSRNVTGLFYPTNVEHVGLTGPATVHPPVQHFWIWKFPLFNTGLMSQNCLAHGILMNYIALHCKCNFL